MDTEKTITEKYELNFLRKENDRQKMRDELSEKYEITGTTDEKAEIISEKIAEKEIEIQANVELQNE